MICNKCGKPVTTDMGIWTKFVGKGAKRQAVGERHLYHCRPCDNYISVDVPTKEVANG